jgi:hypothetical protein
MKKSISALSLVIILVACGAANFATSFRIVVAAGAPILSILEQQGKISPELRAGLITDLTNEGYRVGDMATCFSAIPVGDAQSKVKHLQCVQSLEQAPETRKLLTDFGSNSTVQNIADDFDAVLQAALIFYGGTTRAPGAMTTSRSADVPITEAEIKARVAKLKKDLGQ